jgi:hypothetical protein
MPYIFVETGMLSDKQGYVYILEVADIMLPVCKIGRTERTPRQRCAEINGSSSTGDFKWEVAHQYYVSDCHLFERLIHEKLSPLRQKGKEFFQLGRNDAEQAVDSILAAQENITLVEEPKQEDPTTQIRRSNKLPRFQAMDSRSAEILAEFNSLLEIRGRPFGQLNKPRFGMSDDVLGVQWNIALHRNNEAVHLGVNLEGMKYDGWPIAHFILAELESPTMRQLTNEVTTPEEVVVRLRRDAWQATSRPNIKEGLIGEKEHRLAELSDERWLTILQEALSCLSAERNYRGRAKQMVTLEKKPANGSQVREMPVSPHLTIWTEVNPLGDIATNLKQAFTTLEPVHKWVSVKSAPH